VVCTNPTSRTALHGDFLVGASDAETYEGRMPAVKLSLGLGEDVDDEEVSHEGIFPPLNSRPLSLALQILLKQNSTEESWTYPRRNTEVYSMDRPVEVNTS
jgi:hypothetical protein